MAGTLCVFRLVLSEFKCAGHLAIGLFTLPPAAFVTCYYQLVRINQQGVINIMSWMQGWRPGEGSAGSRSILLPASNWSSSNLQIITWTLFFTFSIGLLGFCIILVKCSLLLYCYNGVNPLTKIVESNFIHCYNCLPRCLQEQLYTPTLYINILKTFCSSHNINIG